MRIGIDSYSYHRLLGELRPSEEAPPAIFASGALDVYEHARSLAVDCVALETSFVDPTELVPTPPPLELVLSWGHPNGVEFGANRGALDDLLQWLELAPTVGCRLVRCVAAGPRFRGAAPVAEQIRATAPLLARACARARELGLALAIENHGDLRAAELAELVERVGDDVLGVCLDTANALRVGDDAVAAAELLAPVVRMVHLKDVEPLENVRDPVAGPCSVPFGQGVVPLREVLAAVGRDDVYVCVELGQLAPGTDELALVEQGVAWLRDYGFSKG